MITVYNDKIEKPANKSDLYSKLSYSKFYLKFIFKKKIECIHMQANKGKHSKFCKAITNN